MIENIEYRLVPGYEPYEVSSCGEFLRNSITKERKATYILTPKGNRTQYIYTDVRNKSISIHRMVALAWLFNDDPVIKTTVNHIDSNGLNNDVSNLEWVSVRDNNLHGVAVGRRIDRIKCKCRNRLTGEIRYFDSLRQMKQYMGLDVRTPKEILFPKMYGKLVKGIWETRWDGDTREWYYLNNKEISYHRYHFIVKNKSDNKMIYDGYDLNTFKSLFYKINKHSVVVILKIFDTEYPNYRLIVEDSYNIKYPFRPLEINKPLRTNIFSKENDNGKVIVFKSLREAAKYYGIDRSVIRSRLDNGIKWNNITFHRDTKIDEFNI